MKRKRTIFKPKNTEQDKVQRAIGQYFDYMAQKTPSPDTSFDERRVYSQIQDQIAQSERKRLKPIHWLSIAASILVVLGIGLWFTANKQVRVADFETLSIKDNPILPGNNTAILTLADGSKISLNEMQTGTITTADGIQITKDENGQISYQHIAESNSKKPIVHSLETPKGGQYTLILPDGTKVWLNADSRIEYPSEFTGNSRNIKLEGEAYFEVTHNAKQPFIVETPQQHVQVLGTSFNVYAYPQETEQTTLVEGSVRVKSSTREVLLIPGQQANINTSQQLTTTQVDPYTFITWKDGDFSFQNTPIKDVMNQISRWYNIDFTYDKESSNLRLSGMVSRSKQLDTVLEVLAMTGKVKFQLEANPKTKERRIRVISI